MTQYHYVRAHTRNGKPVRAHTRRNPGRRGQTAALPKAQSGGWAAAAGCGAVVIWLAYEALRWLAHHWWIILVAGFVVAVAFSIAMSSREGSQDTLEPASELPMRELRDADDATPSEFEALISELLRRDGLDTRLAGGGNNMAVDVIGTDAARGAVLAVQCKHTTVGRRVSATVLYQIFGTAAACNVATHQIVATNGGFTAQAKAWGRDPRHLVHLIDRKALELWMAGRSIYELVA